MSIDANKKIIRMVLDDLTRETTYRTFAERSQFEGHMVDYETSPIRKENAEQREARTNDLRSEMRRAGKALLDIYPDGNTRAIKSITAEDDRVIAEYLVHAGRTIFDPDVEHNFHVLKIFELHEGQIVRMREYCDSAYLNARAGPIAEYMHQTRSGDSSTPPPHSAWSSDWCLAEPPARLESSGLTAGTAQREHNKEVARALSTAWGHESMADLLHPDVFFNNEIDPAVSPVLSTGVTGRERLTEAVRRAVSPFGETLQRTVLAVTAEGNRVVIEEELRGTSWLRPDVELHTRQAKICVLRDGKVHRIRQYLDSAYLQRYSPDLVAHAFEGTALPQAPAVPPTW